MYRRESGIEDKWWRESGGGHGLKVCHGFAHPGGGCDRSDRVLRVSLVRSHFQNAQRTTRGFPDPAIVFPGERLDQPGSLGNTAPSSSFASLPRDLCVIGE